jgi:hypothetical protein
MYLLDTDVLIDIQRGHVPAIHAPPALGGGSSGFTIRPIAPRIPKL